MPLAAALDLIRAGVPVFPCWPDKSPRVASGFHAASTDAAQVHAWWAAWPDSLVAIPTGAASGLYVLDLDCKNGKNGFTSVADAGLVIGEARINWTLNGGAHYLFSQPAGRRTKSDAGVLGAGIDRRGDGGYIIWWPAHGGLVTPGPIPAPPVWMLEDSRAEASGTPGAIVAPPLGLTDAELRAMLRALNPTVYAEYDAWFVCGAALHHETAGEDRGLDLWDEISQTWPKYPGRAELVAKWGSFGRNRTAPRTIRSIAPPGWTRDATGVGFGAVMPAAPGAPGSTGAFVPAVQDVIGTGYMSASEQATHFRGCIYVASVNRVLVPGGAQLNQAQFDAMWGGYSFSLDALNSKAAKGAWDCFTRSQALRFPKADGLCFRPELPPGTIVPDAGQRLANTWWPIDTPSTPGDVAPFLDHLARILPDAGDRAILLAYLAALVQFPGDKFQWCPLIQGVEGNGKSLILAVAEAAVGSKYCHRPNASDLGGNGGKFTGWLAGKCLIGLEEINTQNKAEILEILKPLITGDRVELQGKGVDQFTGDNRANFLMFSNFKAAITKTIRDRRYAIFYTAQQDAGDCERDGLSGDYFPRLYKWLKAGGFAHITHYLRTYAIPAELSPALNNGGLSHRSPETSSTVEAISVGLGTIEQEVQDAIGRGEPGFCGGWVSSVMLTALLRTVGRGMHLTPHKQREMLRGIGYDLHPALVGGRVNNIVQPDNKKPLLYIRAGHLALNEGRPAEVAKMYAAAQFQPMPGIIGAFPQGVVS